MFENIDVLDVYGNKLEYLTQWDVDQTIRVTLDDVNDGYIKIAPKVHFANVKRDKALVVRSRIYGKNVIEVDVPNLILTEPYLIYVYIYVTDSNDVSSQKTIIKFTIPIHKRPQPSNYNYVENIERITAEKIKEELSLEFTEAIGNGKLAVTGISFIDATTGIKHKVYSSDDKLLVDMNAQTHSILDTRDKKELNDTIEYNRDESEKALDAAKRLLNTKIDDNKQETDAALANAKKVLNEKIDANKDATDKALADAKTELNTKIDENKKDSDKALLDAKTELDTKIDNNKQAADKALENAKLELNTKIDNNKQETDDALASAVSDINTTISNTTDTLNAKIDANKQASDTALSDAKAELDNNISSLEERKINFTDIVNDTVTNEAGKPLSAAMALELKKYTDDGVSAHNVSAEAHTDIRGLISGLTDRLNALLDLDDESLDQISEIVAYIKNNKELIDALGTNKVNISDIVNDLITNVANKPLSAAMGVELKKLIDNTVSSSDSNLKAHNVAVDAHADIRTAVADANAAAEEAHAAADAAHKRADDAHVGIETHNTSNAAHADIRELIISATVNKPNDAGYENGAELSADTGLTLGMVTDTTSGIMSAEDKVKLDSLENYVLHPATVDEIGGVKAGSNVTILEDGTISVSDAMSNAVAIFIQTSSATLTDSQAISVAPLLKIWNIGEEYDVNEAITYNDKVYRVAQKHTAEELHTPDIVEDGLYTEIVIGEVGV